MRSRKSEIVIQEEFIERARSGEIVVTLYPIKFANGYFVRGVYETGREIYAGIREGLKKSLQRILDNQEIRLGGAK